MQIMQAVQNLSSKQAISGMAPKLSVPQLAQRQQVLTTTRAAKNPLKAPFKGKVCMHLGLTLLFVSLLRLERCMAGLQWMLSVLKPSICNTSIACWLLSLAAMNPTS